MAEIPRKDRAAIKSDIALSRDRMSRELNGLRYELDFPRKVRQSFRRETILWIAAAAAVGILIVTLPARRKKIYVSARTGGKPKNRLLEAGFVLGALKIAASFARPVIVDLVRSRLFGSGAKTPPPRKW